MRVFSNADTVTQRYNEAEHTVIFKLGYAPISKGWFLVHVPYQLILTITEFEYLEAIWYVKLTFLVHVQYPCICVCTN